MKHLHKNLFSLCAIALAAITFASPALADDWAVSKIQYTNQGGYFAYFRITTEDSAGKTQGCKADKGAIGANGSVTMAVDNSDNSHMKGENCSIAQGDEVWGKVRIDTATASLGDVVVSCRKSKARFFFHPDGGTLKVFTKGTVTNGNRCRIKSKGGVRWDKSKHGSTIYQN